MSDKQGIHLIIDRLDALRARLQQTAEHHATPPTNAGDERLVAQIDHWVTLCNEAKTEAFVMKLALERMTAWLALPVDASDATIAEAVMIMARRLQRLELDRAALVESHTPTRTKVTFSPLDDGPQCEAKGQCKDFDGSGTCYGCGRWLGEEPEPKPSEETLQPFRDALKRESSYSTEEPRASWVLERLEALVIGGWLGDAVKNIERASEYMRANEERMSEDVFDELARVATKLDRWAEEIIRGNMFPESR